MKSDDVLELIQKKIDDKKQKIDVLNHEIGLLEDIIDDIKEMDRPDSMKGLGALFGDDDEE